MHAQPMASCLVIPMAKTLAVLPVLPIIEDEDEEPEAD